MIWPGGSDGVWTSGTMGSVAGASSGTHTRGSPEHVARWRGQGSADRVDVEGGPVGNQSGWNLAAGRIAQFVGWHSVFPSAAGISVVGADATAAAAGF